MSEEPGSVDGAPPDEDDAPTGDGVSELASVGGAPSLAEQRALRSPARSLRRSRDGPSKTPSDRMYREAQERKRLQDEANAKKRTEGCTFAPQFATRRAGSGGSARAYKVDSKSGEERLGHMYEEGKKKVQERRETDAEKVRASEYTFQPNLVSTTSSVSGVTFDDASVSASERLYHHAKESQKRLDDARAEQAASCTFAPDTSETARATRRVSEGNGASPRKPLAQRQDEYARKLAEKREHALKLQQQALARECTFAPTLVAVTHDDGLSATARTDDGADAPTEVTGVADTSVLTSQTGQSAANSGLFFERLDAFVNDCEDKARHRQRVRELKEMEGCTFKPTLVAAGGKGGPIVGGAADGALADDGSQGGGSSRSVFERLQEQARHVELKRDERAKLAEARDAETCTFQPQTTPFAARRESADGGGGGDDESAFTDSAERNVHERLYHKAKASEYEKIEKAEAAEQARLAECTFRPQVLPRAAWEGPADEGDAASEDVHERLYPTTEAQVAARRKLEDKHLSTERAQCTFTPRIAPAPPSSTLSRTQAKAAGGATADERPSQPVHERLFDESRRQAVATQLRLSDARNNEITADCTFAPNIKSPMKGAAGGGAVGQAASGGAAASKRAGAGADAAVHRRLSLEASRRLQQHGKNARLREANTLKECSFKPAIPTYKPPGAPERAPAMTKASRLRAEREAAARARVEAKAKPAEATRKPAVATASPARALGPTAASTSRASPRAAPTASPQAATAAAVASEGDDGGPAPESEIAGDGSEVFEPTEGNGAGGMSVFEQATLAGGSAAEIAGAFEKWQADMDARFNEVFDLESAPIEPTRGA